jgi:hypothetical protein
LPGSEDHQRLTRTGEWMDPDLNKYDLNHRVTHHPRMSDAEWDQAYADVWHRFYSMDHMETILKRMAALGSNKKLTTLYRLLWYRDFHRLYGCHPLEGGFGRIKVRTDRRYGMKRENPVTFYARFAGSEVRNVGSMFWTYLRLSRRLKAIWADPRKRRYRDVAITPPAANELSLSLYAETRGTAAAIAKDKHQAEIKRAARARKPALEPVILDAAE